MHLTFIFLGTFLITFISCLPVQQQKKDQQESSILSNENQHNEQQQQIEDRIQVDLFSQLLSTHWQFDHLDSIMSQSHKEIADHIQNHIEIDIQPQPSSSPSSHQPSLSSFEISSQQQQQQQQLPWQQQPIKKMTRPSISADHMEYDLLKSQMMNAIQARTQGLLPEMWDQVGEALGRPAIESYVQQLLRSACPIHQEWVAMSCFEHHASHLSSQLDDYVQHHLTTIWTHFQQEALPNLLDSTVKELEKVVDYFNDEAFFSSGSSQHRIIVNTLPWSSSSNLPVDLVSLSSLDDHSLFSNFVTLAKI